GGVPLPGGVTYVRMDLIRSRVWQSAVSAAGPAMNFLIFLGCCLPFHPNLAWIDPSPVNGQWPNYVLFLGAFAWVQMLTCLFNLVPVPGLDGFGIIEPFMDAHTRSSLTPQLRRSLMIVWFMVLWHVPAVGQAFHRAGDATLSSLGFDGSTINFFGQAFNSALFGELM